jgi:site-specific recombinase XerD
VESLIAEYSIYQSVIQQFTERHVRATSRELGKLRQYLQDKSLTVHDVDLATLEAHLAQRSKGCSPGYLALMVGQLRGFFVYVAQQGIRTDNPARWLEYPKFDRLKRLPSVVPQETVERFVAWLRERADSLVGKRNLALVTLLYSTGLRVGEAAALKLDDLRWDESVVVVREGKGRKERRVPLLTEAAETLDVYLQTRSGPFRPSDPVFVTWQNDCQANRLTSGGLYSIVNVQSEAFGVKICPHQLRHSCASHLLSEGGRIVSIQRLLGHERVRTTLDYARVQDPEVAQAVERHPINGRAPAQLTPLPKSPRPLRRHYTGSAVAVGLQGRLWEQVEMFLAHAEHLSRYTAGTIKAFRCSLARFAVAHPALCTAGVESVRPREVLTWLGQRRRAGHTHRTVINNLSNLRTFFAFAQRRGWRHDDPTASVKLVDSQGDEAVYLSEEEILRLLAAPDRATQEGYTDYIAMLLLYATGLRAAELCNLNMPDVDLRDGWVTVRGSKGRDRQVPIPKAVVADLKRYVHSAQPDGAFLRIATGDRLKPGRLARHLERYAQAAGSSRPVTPHTIRHTYAAHLLKAGVRPEVVAKAMGHRTLSELTPYIHCDFDDIREAVKKLRKNLPQGD